MKFSKSFTVLGLASTLAISSFIELSQSQSAFANQCSDNLLTSTANNQETITTKNENSRMNQLVAINLQGCSPSRQFNRNTWGLALTFSQQCLDNMLGISNKLNQIGRVKDTEFNKVDVSNLRFSLINGGIRVQGQVRHQHRERTLPNPFTGRWVYTSWFSTTASFSQELPVSFRQGRLYAEAGRSNINIYGLSSGELNSIVQSKVNDALQDINGRSAGQLFITYGSNQFARVPGINPQSIGRLIDAATSRINASVNGQGLTLSIQLKK